MQSGKVNLATKTSIKNGTIKPAAAPFPLKDTSYYQVDAHGDYVQERN